MFLRRKKNKSGVISIQVVDKSSGVYKMVSTIGSSADANEIEKLVLKGEQWIKERLGNFDLDFSNEREIIENFLSNIREVTIKGTDLLLGKIFDQIGFNQIDDPLFRKLVIARLCFPASKLKTTDYFSKYHFLEIQVQDVYRYLDKLYNTQKEKVQQISYTHTLKILNNEISIVFYDVTTLYFEIDNEDELRKTGFSKEGKHQHPQIVLGLLVSMDGYPLAYEIFEGNKFEGYTMLPIIEAFKSKYSLTKLIVIADSGLLSKDNVTALQTKGYEFILGARIKNENKTLKEKILNLKLKNGESEILPVTENNRLIISYSESRAKKDKSNRERGLRKLEKSINSGRLTKSNINNRGYNKYLKLEGEIKISIDENKFKEDAKWDGLKGYLTNTTLSKEETISNYNQLWKIEKAFRIAKTDLKVRPVFHRAQRRIEAHICIAFVAYKLYKELERQLKEKKSTWSPEKAIEIAKVIYGVKAVTPTTKEEVTKILYLTEEQRNLATLFDF